MKKLSLIVIIILSSLLIFSQQSYGQDLPTTSSSLKVDVHWIDIFQYNDTNTVKVDEYMFINNTGTTPFNDSIFVWIQDNSNIIADCCGGAPDMGCRYRDGGYMSCFTFFEMENNIYVGNPFHGDNKLSYYGQREMLTISASSPTNMSVLHLNATIGGIPIPRQAASQHGAIQITSPNTEIGMRQEITVNIPHNLTMTEVITISNNGTSTEVIDLDVGNLPQDWTGSFWNDTDQVSNISLNPTEKENLTLVITAPSYITPIYVGYVTELNTDGGGTTGSFTKEFIYETKEVESYLFLMSDEGIEISEDQRMVHPFADEEPSWNEDNGRYWYVTQANNVQPNTISTISMALDDVQTQSGGFQIWVLLIIAIVVILVLFLINNRRIISGDEVEEEESLEEELIDEKKTLQEMVGRIETDLADGLINEETALGMKIEYESKINDIDREFEDVSDDPEVGDDLEDVPDDQEPDNEKIKLEEKKRKVMQAIKRVDQEFEEGIIQKEDYERFKTSYKKRAVEIMKELDDLKE